MALFRTINSPEPLPPIAGDGVVLRTPQMSDHAAWSAVRDSPLPMSSSASVF